MTVFSLYVKGEEIIKDDDDDDSFVDKIDNYCIVAVNNSNIQDSSMFVTYGPKPIVNVKIYDNVVIVNSIPHIVENNVMLTCNEIIYDFEDVNTEDLEKAYMKNVELDWEKLDNNEITANEMVTNYLVKEYQEVIKNIKEQKKKNIVSM